MEPIDPLPGGPRSALNSRHKINEHHTGLKKKKKKKKKEHGLILDTRIFFFWCVIDSKITGQFCFSTRRGWNESVFYSSVLGGGPGVEGGGEEGERAPGGGTGRWTEGVQEAEADRRAVGPGVRGVQGGGPRPQVQPDQGHDQEDDSAHTPRPGPEGIHPEGRGAGAGVEGLRTAGGEPETTR